MLVRVSPRVHFGEVVMNKLVGVWYALFILFSPSATEGQEPPQRFDRVTVSYHETHGWRTSAVTELGNAIRFSVTPLPDYGIELEVEQGEIVRLRCSVGAAIRGVDGQVARVYLTWGMVPEASCTAYILR